MYAVAWSLDWHHLASTDEDGTVRIWANTGLTPASAIDLICGNLRRDLSSVERKTYLPSTGSNSQGCPQSSH
ncbi:hypothetical protein ACWGLF_41045 [Streptomyces puniciscabiei]